VLNSELNLIEVVSYVVIAVGPEQKASLVRMPKKRVLDSAGGRRGLSFNARIHIPGEGRRRREDVDRSEL
jgi:hypothetical protein